MLRNEPAQMVTAQVFLHPKITVILRIISIHGTTSLIILKARTQKMTNILEMISFHLCSCGGSERRPRFFQYIYQTCEQRGQSIHSCAELQLYSNIDHSACAEAQRDRVKRISGQSYFGRYAVEPSCLSALCCSWVQHCLV